MKRKTPKSSKQTIPSLDARKQFIDKLTVIIGAGAVRYLFDKLFEWLSDA